MAYAKHAPCDGRFDAAEYKRLVAGAQPLTSRDI